MVKKKDFFGREIEVEEITETIPEMLAKIKKFES